MRDNEDFLRSVYETIGKTNLNEYFTTYLKEKEEAEKRAKEPKDLMLPPNLTQNLNSDNNNAQGGNNSASGKDNGAGSAANNG